MANNNEPRVNNVTSSTEVRRILLDLSDRMVQSFNQVLNETSNDPEYTRYFADGMVLSVGKTFAPSLARYITCAVGSLWLPFPFEAVFDLLSKENRRHEWDIFSCRNPVREFSNIQGGTDVGNRISIIKPSFHGNMLIIQQTCTNPSESSVVYTATYEPKVNAAARGLLQPSQLDIYASGFVISKDGCEASNTENAPRTGRCLLTMAFQIPSSSGPAMTREGSVASSHMIFMNTIGNIKRALSS
ncbi:hypothetical protein RIF29_04073 [Crotalaria pallida]|uniref:HD-Zip IV C-terminal domain-containing protein n=1 Tax=Crotalaria pallida TaxID=3830 RepID=A0AAN9J0U3_CROPI